MAPIQNSISWGWTTLLVTLLIPFQAVEATSPVTMCYDLFPDKCASWAALCNTAETNPENILEIEKYVTLSCPITCDSCPDNVMAPFVPGESTSTDAPQHRNNGDHNNKGNNNGDHNNKGNNGGGPGGKLKSKTKAAKKKGKESALRYSINYVETDTDLASMKASSLSGSQMTVLAMTACFFGAASGLVAVKLSRRLYNNYHGYSVVSGSDDSEGAPLSPATPSRAKENTAKE